LLIFSLWYKNRMKKHLRVRWWIFVLSSMFLCYASDFISSRIGIDTFSWSAPLGSLLIVMQHIIRIILVLLWIFVLLSWFFLHEFFQNNWEKWWRAFVPIHNIRVLSWIIGIETKSFSVVLRWLIIWIIILLLIPRYQCACYSYSEFSASLFLFLLCLYCFWFIVFMLYRLHKYNSNKGIKNDKNN